MTTNVTKYAHLGTCHDAHAQMLIHDNLAPTTNDEQRAPDTPCGSVRSASALFGLVYTFFCANPSDIDVYITSPRRRYKVKNCRSTYDERETL